jgi:hypothetical protein
MHEEFLWLASVQCTSWDSSPVLLTTEETQLSYVVSFHPQTRLNIMATYRTATMATNNKY